MLKKKISCSGVEGICIGVSSLTNTFSAIPSLYTVGNSGNGFEKKMFIVTNNHSNIKDIINTKNHNWEPP